MEVPVRSPIEGSPEVGDEDLSAFVEVDNFGMEGVRVVEGGDVLRKQIDEAAG